MTEKEFQALKTGDVVRNRWELRYVVTEHHGDRVTVAATHSIANPEEWTLVPREGEKPARGSVAKPGKRKKK
jgi:hypothetical protein